MCEIYTGELEKWKGEGGEQNLMARTRAETRSDASQDIIMYLTVNISHGSFRRRDSQLQQMRFMKGLFTNIKKKNRLRNKILNTNSCEAF